MLSRISNILTQYKHLFFGLIWVVFGLFFEYQNILFKEPVSVHQGAQSDRASIALNYARVNMNFFEPRVMETGTHDGVTPCEFPIINYSVAIGYSIFGYHIFLYRLLMWLIVSLGVWSVFDVLSRVFKAILPAILLTFAWFFGSILCYYTPNFLPDAASLGLLLIGGRFWYLYSSDSQKKWLSLFTVFVTLACLVKITSLIFVIALAIIEFPRLLKIKHHKQLWLSFIIIAAAQVLWLWYCNYLEKKVGGSYFLMSINTFGSLAELKEWFHIFYANWFQQIYCNWQWYFILAGLLALPFAKLGKRFLTYTLLCVIGVAAFYLLMAAQFRYHDYYVITLLPVFLLLMVSAFMVLKKINSNLAVVITFAVMVMGWIDAKNSVRLRFTPDNYWYQTFFEPYDFKQADVWLTQNGVSKNHKILACFDPNPNALLYALKRRGYRSADHSAAYVAEKLNVVKAVVLTDTALFNKRYPETRKKLKPKSQLGGLYLFVKQ